MQLANWPEGHLTYCLNVHDASTLEGLHNAVFHHAKSIFDRVRSREGITGRFGLGLWLSDAVSRELESDTAFAPFAEQLREQDMYVFTLNGFPYGAFHGQRVKEQVYRPDWAQPERAAFTVRIAEILARLLPPRVTGSISTLPITYRAWADEARIRAACGQVRSVAQRLHELKNEHGTTIRLAIEPEPDCLLDETPDAVEFFETWLFSGKDEAILREHVGICLDTVHCGVLGERPAMSLRRYREAGIRVPKVQLGAALVAEAEEGLPSRLHQFVDEVYLHQTLRLSGQGLARRDRFADLPEAIASDRPRGRCQWRVHFHMPLSWEGGNGLSTTADDIDAEFFTEARATGVEHFEGEVYTLGVLPGAAGREHEILADEFAWIHRRLV